MTSRWVVRTYRFSDDKRWLILSSTILFVCPFFELLEMKKNVSLLPEKNNNFFLYLFYNAFFLFCFCQKKQVFLLLGFKQRKKQQQLSLFASSFFFCFRSDDNWWQMGRWYGIPNLVMTWWLGWVVITKWSKCWWRHIEMVPEQKQLFFGHFKLIVQSCVQFFIYHLLAKNLAKVLMQRLWTPSWNQYYFWQTEPNHFT